MSGRRKWLRNKKWPLRNDRLIETIGESTAIGEMYGNRQNVSENCFSLRKYCKELTLEQR